METEEPVPLYHYNIRHDGSSPLNRPYQVRLYSKGEYTGQYHWHNFLWKAKLQGRKMVRRMERRDAVRRQAGIVFDSRA